MLRSPAHGLLDGSLLLLTYTGRSSGRTFTIPLLFARHECAVVALAVGPARKQWWRAFRDPAPATLRLDGETVSTDGRLLEGEEAAAALRAYAARFPRAAARLGVPAGASDADVTEAAARVALVAFDIVVGPVI